MKGAWLLHGHIGSMMRDLMTGLCLNTLQGVIATRWLDTFHRVMRARLTEGRDY